MVASTVYGFQEPLEQICVALKTYGYDVWNSHLGTIPVHPWRSNLQNCVDAAKKCDAFVGIIRPFYGSGIIGKRSITHEELITAIHQRKPRWFLAHRDVVFAKQLLRQYMYDKQGKRKRFQFRKTAVMDDLRVIDMYDDAIQTTVNPAARVGHWVQEFFRLEEALRYIDAQFQDIAQIRQIISKKVTP